MKFKLTFKKHKIVPIVCFVAAISPMQLLAQQVAGRIISRLDGHPLSDVTITNRDISSSVKSASDGTFQIKAQKGNKLYFTLIGFQSKDMVVQKQSETFKVELETAQKNLEEVVVTALGIKRESKGLSYSTQQIKAEAVSGIKDNSGNFITSLNGKVAGAVITTASGGPGSSARIVLRGNKSITGNNNALIVIDGIVFDNSSVTQNTSGYANVYSSSDGGANINPEDIESINILKGPSAAALYGSRAVNGAVIITTKQGAAGQWRLDFNTTQTVETASNLPNFQQTYGRGNGGAYGSNAVDSWGEKAETNPDNVKSFFQKGYSNSHTLSASGGSEKVTSFFSFTNAKIGGIVPKNYMDRNNLDLRVNTELIKGLKTDIKLSYISQNILNKTRLSANGVMAQLFTMPRDMSEEEFGNYEKINPGTGLPESVFWSTNVNTDNPLWTINRTSVNEKRDRVNGLGSISYQFFPWMNFMTRISFDRYNEKTQGSFFNGTKANGNVLPGGQYFEIKSEYSNQNIDFLFTGSPSLGSENIKLNYIVGSSLLTRNYNTVTDMANGLVVPNNFSLAFAATPTYSGIQSYRRHLNSVFASANLALWESVYLDITGRNDWSSTLPAPHSYFYPSVGLSLVLNKWLKLPQWVSLAKVRGSYTQVGNDAEPNLLTQTYSYTTATGVGFITRNPSKNINNLKPEKTNSLEAGMDVQFFNNRLSLAGTYYKSNSKNQLMFLSVTNATGFNNQYINAGEIQNQGFELQLQAKPIQTAHFTWETNLNFARNINKVISLANGISLVNISDNTAYATAVVAAGSAYGDLYGYKWKKDAASGKYIVNSLGLPVVENGKKIGNYNPSSTLGWSNNFKFKNWGLHVNIDGRIGGEMVSGTAALLADYGVADFTTEHRDGSWILDAVDEAGNKNIKEIKAESFWTAVGAGGIYPYGQLFTFDMTNFRVRNLGISYRAPQGFIPYVKDAQFTFSMNNVLFLYKGKSIIDIPGVGKIKNPVDPEAAIGSSNFQGVEAAVLPTTRSFTLGVKLSF